MRGDPKVPLNTKHITLQINGHSIIAMPNLKIHIDGNAKSIYNHPHPGPVANYILDGTSMAILICDSVVSSVDTRGT